MDSFFCKLITSHFFRNKMSISIGCRSKLRKMNYLLFVMVILLLIWITFTNLQLRSPVLPRSDYITLIDLNFSFKILPLVCTGTVPAMLALVHSFPDHFCTRNAIRETWAQFESNVKVLFVMGLTKTNDVQERLEAENKMNGDIIQGNFLDSYYNLTYKHVMVLKYLVYYCSNVHFVLKTDDEVLVNIPNVKIFASLFLFRSDKTKEIMLSKWNRREIYRWSVSVAKSPKKYPIYCGGWAVFNSHGTVFAIYAEAQRNNYFWIDDIYTAGGILALKASVHHIKMDEFILRDVQMIEIVNKSYTHLTRPLLYGWIELTSKEISTIYDFIKTYPEKENELEHIKCLDWYDVLCVTFLRYSLM